MTEECACLKQKPGPGGFGAEVDCPRRELCQIEWRSFGVDWDAIGADVTEWRKLGVQKKGGMTIYGVPLSKWWDMDDQQRAWARWSYDDLDLGG